MIFWIIYALGFIAAYTNGSLFGRKYYHLDVWDRQDVVFTLFLSVSSWLFFTYIMLVRFDVINEKWLSKPSKW